MIKHVKSLITNRSQRKIIISFSVIIVALSLLIGINISNRNQNISKKEDILPPKHTYHIVLKEIKNNQVIGSDFDDRKIIVPGPISTTENTPDPKPKIFTVNKNTLISIEYNSIPYLKNSNTRKKTISLRDLPVGTSLIINTNDEATTSDRPQTASQILVYQASNQFRGTVKELKDNSILISCNFQSNIPDINLSPDKQVSTSENREVNISSNTEISYVDRQEKDPLNQVKVLKLSDLKPDTNLIVYTYSPLDSKQIIAERIEPLIAPTNPNPKKASK